MGITAIARDWGNDSPALVRILTTDTVATASATNYILAQQANIELVNNGLFTWLPTDGVFIACSDGSFFATISPDFNSLIAIVFTTTVIGLPVTVGSIPVFASTSGNLEQSVYSIANNLLIQPSAAGITAHPGGGQASATPLTAAINSVKFIATAGDSVKLPPAVPGLAIMVININDTTAMQVFGTGSDEINLVASSTGISQQPDTTIVYTSVVAGFWTTSIVSTNFPTPTLLPTATGIVAHAGGGQSSATPLPAYINTVPTIATNGDSVLLPPSQVGLQVKVINTNDAHYMEVFPNGTDTINLGAASAGIPQLPDTTIVYTCTTLGNWITSIISINFPVPTLFPSATGIVALAGGGQAGATPLVSYINTVPTVATNGDSVLLPPSVVGLQVKVINTNATNYMEVFPNGTDTINLGAASAGVPQLPETTIIYTCTTLGNWITSIISSNYPVPSLFPFATGIVPHAGGGQTSATLLTALFNSFNTVTTNGDSIKLPAAVPFLQVTAQNLNNFRAAQVFGSGTDTINLIATGTGVSLLPNTSIVFTCTIAGNWNTTIVSGNYPSNQIATYISSVPLTATQFNGMYAAPVLLVPAPGVGFMIAADKMELVMTYGTTPFAAGGIVAGQYGATVYGAGSAATNTEAAADFFAAASTVFQFTGVSGNTVGAIPLANATNAALYLSNATGAFTTGDSTFVVKTYYKIINLAGSF